MKVCTKCKEEKSLDCYGKQKGGLFGIRSACFECRRIEQKIYFEKNREIINKKHRDRYKQNVDNERKRSKIYRDLNKEKRKIYEYKYREENKERIKEYYQKNREKVKNKARVYIAKKRSTDPIFKFKCNLRSLIKSSFKRGVNQFIKKSKTESILCCTIEEFILHIEKQFTEGMTLENHGQWHLDHIKPISLATTEEEVIALNHYTNFQPLWAEDNLRKGNKYEEIR